MDTLFSYEQSQSASCFRVSSSSGEVVLSMNNSQVGMGLLTKKLVLSFSCAWTVGGLYSDSVCIIHGLYVDYIQTVCV